MHELAQNTGFVPSFWPFSFVVAPSSASGSAAQKERFNFNCRNNRVCSASPGVRDPSRSTF
jgi:hypothetical protein